MIWCFFILLLNKRDQIQNVSNIRKGGEWDKLLKGYFKDYGDDMRHVFCVYKTLPLLITNKCSPVNKSVIT